MAGFEEVYLGEEVNVAAVVVQVVVEKMSPHAPSNRTYSTKKGPSISASWSVKTLALELTYFSLLKLCILLPERPRRDRGLHAVRRHLSRGRWRKEDLLAFKQYRFAASPFGATLWRCHEKTNNPKPSRS